MKKIFKERFEKEVPKKNYLIVTIVSILVIVITLYVRSFYLNYQANRINNSVFHDKTINQINLEDIDYAVNETVECIIYVSYTGNKDVYNMEKRLYKEIENKNLFEKFIYLDVTERENDYLDVLRAKFPDIAYQITSAPLFIYIKDGEAKEAFSSELKNINYNVLNNVINKYEIE